MKSGCGMREGFQSSCPAMPVNWTINLSLVNWVCYQYFMKHRCGMWMASVGDMIFNRGVWQCCCCCCSSHKRVVKEVQDRMVADHLATVHAETGTMVCSERTRDLSNMYTLLRPVPNGLTQLVHHLKEHIKQQGLQAITNLKGDNVSDANTSLGATCYWLHKEVHQMENSLWMLYRCDPVWRRNTKFIMHHNDSHYNVKVMFQSNMLPNGL